MDGKDQELIASAEKGALEVLLHNSEGPFFNLPRTAGWGYPEPYTRDLSISALGIAVSKNSILIEAMQRVLETLAKNQSEKGQIPSLVHDKDNLGASDTTACFLMAVGIFRKVLHDPTYLQEAVERAVRWLEYQCPTRRFLIAQQPTSDWRDEQWVLGYGLYVNTLSYLALRVLEKEEKASHLGHAINCPTYASDTSHQSPHEGLLLENKPYYALWSYKVYSSDRFDLLGNSLAVLSGLASQSKAEAMVDWITREWEMMKKNKSLAVEITPNSFHLSTLKMPIGCRDTENSTSPVTITTGVYGHLSAGFILRPWWQQNCMDRRKESCWPLPIWWPSRKRKNCGSALTNGIRPKRENPWGRIGKPGVPPTIFMPLGA